MTQNLSAADVFELSNRLARGDRAALSALFGAYGGMVLASVLRLLRNRAEAEEVVQEAFLDVWRLARHYQPERAAFSTWVVTIAKTRAIDRLRSNDSRSRTAEALALESAHASAPPIETGADGPKLKACLAALSGEQRHTLELAYFEGLSQSEIAERTGTPLGTVKTRTRQALRKMSEMLRVDDEGLQNQGAIQ
jgi:RNA polymerase sigma-70 factor (ECF subfamily)